MARTAALEAILEDYTLLLEALDEIHSTTHDDYSLKAGGLMHSLEKFSTLFGIQLSQHSFSATEQDSFTLQEKNVASGCTLCCWCCQTIFHKSEIRTEFLSVL